MKNFKKEARAKIWSEIVQVMEEMEKMEDKTSNEYNKISNRLDSLTATLERMDRGGISDTVKIALISGGFMLLATVLTIKHEEFNIITSKAWGRLGKF